MIITIDGTVATGKSTIAKKLAEAIGFIFFDTGAMYRALTYGILKQQIPIDNSELLEEYLNHFNFEIKVIRRERRYFVDNEDVTEIIRKDEVTSSVSKISAIKAIRDKLVDVQRNLAMGVNAVFEGRDMGTVVFPSAHLKIFLTAREDVRAKRRYDELVSKFPEESKNLTLEKCREEIAKRDLFDTTREHSPLKKAEDAFIVDTSDLSIEEVVYRILEIKDTIRTSRNFPPGNHTNL